MDDFLRFVEEEFTRDKEYFVPRDKGKIEYRKCGLKKDKHLLRIEEVLYEYYRRNKEKKKEIISLSEAHGYHRFRGYSILRDMDYILLPTDTPLFYSVYLPNKHFNRKKDTSIGVSFFVDGDDDVFSKLQMARGTVEAERYLIAISDREECVVVDVAVRDSIRRVMEECIVHGKGAAVSSDVE